MTISTSNIPSYEITLGDYIAAGGMGKVYKAKWQHNEVAVKQLLVGGLSAAGLDVTDIWVSDHYGAGAALEVL